jgi:hypothetical protein
MNLDDSSLGKPFRSDFELFAVWYSIAKDSSCFPRETPVSKTSASIFSFDLLYGGENDLRSDLFEYRCQKLDCYSRLSNFRFT